MKKNIKLCAKGSRKKGQEFIDETNYLVSLSDCIEIDFNYPHDTGFEKEIEFLRKLKDIEKINYTVHAQYLNGSLNDFNDKIREETIKEIYRSIDNAKEIGSNMVTLHPALEPYGLKLEKRTELEIDSYKKIASYALKKNINIGLENEAQTHFWFPDRACKFNLLIKTIEDVGFDNFGMTVDFGHANITGEDYISALKKYSSKILHVHAHDNLQSIEKNMNKYNRPDPHLSPGKGTINWDEIIATLKEIDYQNYFTLECEIHEMADAIKFINKKNR